jgi:Cft2 family RNA processing exonuclease
MSPEVEIQHNRGLYLPELELWLDAERKVDLSVISHAHADHIVNHKKIIATPETARLFALRKGNVETEVLEYGKPLKLRGASIRLFPAGHILGSSQVLVEYKGIKIVYTGDFKLRESLTCRSAEVKRCDILIMESTYGLPEYVFPETAETHRKIVDWVKDTRDAGEVPIVMAYSLGKAQEAMKLLGDAGFDLSVHKAIYEIAEIYQEFGVKFGNYDQWRPGSAGLGVVLVPPHLSRWKPLDAIKKRKKLLLTGWALDPSTKYRYDADAVLPLSDHADFTDLMAYAKEAKPKKVYVVHGFPEFVDYLREEGFDAEALGEEASFVKQHRKKK